jgi:pimeloyl-ACP methyl ester carboxylesterase
MAVVAAAQPSTWSERFANLSGVRLHYVEAGAGPLVLLLHGFPEFWGSWRYQIPALVDAGFRVLAPDLRGYNLSDKPAGVESYRVANVVGDVAGLIQHAGEERAALVGHDWGGGIAWATAMRHPEIVHRLVILNAPHPAAYLRELRSPGQLLRSWYVFVFQLPFLPEWLVRAGDYALVERALRGEPTRLGAFTEEDIRDYKQALGRPGALTAAINYYRAAFRHRRDLQRRLRPIDVPTLLLWGERDRYLGIRLTEGLEPWVPRLRVERFPDAGHWVHREVPERVNRSLTAFLRTEG